LGRGGGTGDGSQVRGKLEKRRARKAGKKREKPFRKKVANDELGCGKGGGKAYKELGRSNAKIPVMKDR